MNDVKSSQLAIVVFFMPLAFRIAMLPSILGKIAGTSSYIAIGIIGILDFLQLLIILAILKFGGFKEIKDKYGKTAQRILALPFFLVFSVKAILFVTEIAHYTCNTFFYNAKYMPILGIIIITICYLSTRGARCLSRLCTLSIWMLPIIILVGISYGNLNLKPEYLFPFRDKSFSDMLSAVWHYSIYSFGYSALLFINLNDTKRKAIIIGSIINIVFLVGWYAIFIASYGYATYIIPNSFSVLMTFNTVISEVGSLELYSSILWLFISITNLSFKIFALGEIAGMFNINKTISITVLGALLFGVCLTIFSTYEKALELCEGFVKYIITAISVIIPIIMGIMLSVKEKKEEKNMIMPNIIQEN